LTESKAALVRYVDSQRYSQDLDRVAARAARYLRRQVPGAERPAMVLDIDETSLSNWPYEVDSNFCYDSQEFNAWVERAEAEPIAGVLELYRIAHSLEVAVFFVTGRHPDQREATETNLRAVGFESWEGLDMRPRNDGESSASVFKTAVRRRITDEGYTILVSVGDQHSDLAGGYAQRTYKLPNPFYEVP
jgi:acid phosphatase